jgi:hypothetical protein
MKKVLIVIKSILLSIGNCGGPLIMRLYFIHGGKESGSPASSKLVAGPSFSSHSQSHTFTAAPLKAQTPNSSS